MKREKKMKKAMALATAAMSVLILAGCQKGENKETAAIAEDGATVLSMWVHETDSAEGKLYKTMVDEFNEVHKGEITVNLTSIPRTGDAGGYDDKVNAAITNNDMPDVYTVDGPTVAANAEAGIIVPIGDYFEESDLNDFNKDIIQQGTYNGELYTVAAMDSSVLLFYNKDMFEAAGIEPATMEDPWTWDEFYEAARLLSSDGVFGANLGGLTTADEWLTYALLPMVQSAGGNIISEDGEETVAGYMDGEAAVRALSFIKKMVDEKIVSATPEDFAFEKGSAAMVLSGPWEASTLKDYPDIDWGTMPYPIYEEGAKAASPCGSWTFAMSKNCQEEKREAAAELIQFVSSTQSCVSMYGANSMPPARQSAFLEIPELNEEPLNVITYQLAETAAARPAVVNYPILSDQFARAVANVASGMEVETALKDAVDQYNFQTGK